MQAGRIAGVRILVNTWFVVIVVLFVLAGLAFKAGLVFISLLWHELAHILVAAALGYRVREVELLPFGGVARIERLGEAGAGEELLLGAAGPAASLFLAAALQYLSLFGGWPEEAAFFLTANLTIGLFNLLPALPLDGGRILRAALSPSLGGRRATAVVVGVSRLTATVLFVALGSELWRTGAVNLTCAFAGAVILTGAAAEGARNDDLRLDRP